MRLVNECFNTVKKDYFKFLNKEKISGKSKAEKIKNLKKIQILDDKAQNKEARENIRMLPNKTGLRPNLSESGPKITCRMAVIAR